MWPASQLSFSGFQWNLCIYVAPFWIISMESEVRNCCGRKFWTVWKAGTLEYIKCLLTQSGYACWQLLVHAVRLDIINWSSWLPFICSFVHLLTTLCTMMWFQGFNRVHSGALTAGVSVTTTNLTSLDQPQLAPDSKLSCLQCRVFFLDGNKGW